MLSMLKEYGTLFLKKLENDPKYHNEYQKLTNYMNKDKRK